MNSDTVYLVKHVEIVPFEGLDPIGDYIFHNLEDAEEFCERNSIGVDFDLSFAPKVYCVMTGVWRQFLYIEEKPVLNVVPKEINLKGDRYS